MDEGVGIGVQFPRPAPGAGIGHLAIHAVAQAVAGGVRAVALVDAVELDAYPCRAALGGQSAALVVVNSPKEMPSPAALMNWSSMHLLVAV